MSGSQALFSAAVRLDELPRHTLAYEAGTALEALEQTHDAARDTAAQKGFDASLVDAVWGDAAARLRAGPEDDLFRAAADAASLLYTAAWLLDTPEANGPEIELML
jgi:hypothetical protein